MQLDTDTSVELPHAAATVFLATILILWIKNVITYRAPEPLVYMPNQIGDISLQSLRKYDGRDPFMPLLLAVRGKVYDVTEGKDFYGVGEEQAWADTTQQCTNSCTCVGAPCAQQQQLLVQSHFAAVPALLLYVVLQHSQVCNSLI